jgi:Copper type II ascorbate-dependent monooxygenase, C-terminal domain
LTTTYIMEKETVIPMMLSHYHKRGEKFEVRRKGGAKDGELLYSSEDYENPLLKVFPTPVVLKAGEGLVSTVTYNNTTNRTLTFGITSEDEMNFTILFKFNR